MANNRIFYACQGVALAPIGTAPTAYNSGNMVHGLQSIGVTTNFNLEQVFELGQIDIYENIEGLPDVEVTLEKVLDGYPLIYHMATSGADLTNQPSLAGRSKQRADLRLFIADEGRNNINSSIVAGDPRTSVYCSGMFVSSISYSLPVDGNFTESVTLVGNNKKWFRSLDNVPTNVFVNFDSADEPLAYTLIGSGGVQRREDFILADSILPTSIDGVNGNVAGNGLNGDVPRVHLQNVTVSTDFSREDILELGRKLPYYRPANFPIEVTCEIEAISVSGDFVDALEDGRTEFVGQKDQGNNLANETIYLVTRAGYAFDLGSKNKLSSVSYGGGDAGGGNVSCTYSYSNFNVLDVQQRNRTPFGFGGITAAT
jgi:hypothetical protein